MKRILVISELFYPTNRIGALRPSKICKFLIEKGYDVDIITAYPAQGIYESKNSKVYSIYKTTFSPNISIQETRWKKINNNFVNQLRYFKRTFFFYLKEKKYTRKVFKLFKNEILNIENYDACFTTYGPISSVLIGLKLKKRYHIKNWICDFRDPIAGKMCSMFMYPFYKHLQNQSCKYADKIVAVSNGYLQRICKDKYQKKAYMIPNGYDVSDKNYSFVQYRKNKFVLTYVGTLYEGKRDVSPIFRAISELNFDGSIDINNVSFVYAGTDFASLLAQAEKYSMQNILENKGSLSREACLKIQYESTILVLSTWNERGEEGVFPGKFLEYMLIGKPIISLTCGNLSNSEVTSVMQEGNFGVAYESANDEKDFSALKNYIKKSYDLFLRTGNIPFEPKQEVLERYSYTTIMKRIEELL